VKHKRRTYICIETIIINHVPRVPCRHIANTFDVIQKATKNDTTRIAIRHVLRPPSPMPNACPARRDVCASEAPKELKRLPWNGVRPHFTGTKVQGTDGVIQHQVLSFDIIIDISRNLWLFGIRARQHWKSRCDIRHARYESLNEAHLTAGHFGLRRCLQHDLWTSTWMGRCE